jgi:integrase
MVRIYKYENDVPLYEVYVNIRSKSGRRMQKRVRGFKSKVEAEKFESKLLREAERDLIEKEAAGETWRYVVEKFEENISVNQNLQVHTRLDYVAAVRKHTGSFMNRPISSITRADAKSLFMEFSLKGLSIGHQKKIKIILNRMHTFAADEGMMPEGANPFRAIEFPKEKEKVPEILSIEEIKLLLKTARDTDHPWYPVWAMALLTGMRNGELYALTFQDVDFENKLITLSRSYNTRTRSFKSTKSGDWRQIPISAELEKLLKELKLKAGVRKEVLPRFPGWEKGMQAKVLRTFCKLTGLPSIKFHTLRACFATQLIRTGVPPIQIQKICGWKDLETMQIYIRLAGIDVQGVTDGLKLLPETEIMGKVVNLFGSGQNS